MMKAVTTWLLIRWDTKFEIVYRLFTYCEYDENALQIFIHLFIFV